MPRTSLSAVEIFIRQTKEDAELDPYPLIRGNLLTKARALARRVDRDEEVVALGLLLNLRAMLLAIPTGRLRTPDAMGLIVRIEEQNLKGNNALRRRRARMVVPRGSVLRRPVPGMTLQGAGEPAEVEDDGQDEAQETGAVEPAGEVNEEAAEAAGGE